MIFMMNEAFIKEKERYKRLLFRLFNLELAILKAGDFWKIPIIIEKQRCILYRLVEFGLSREEIREIINLKEGIIDKEKDIRDVVLIEFLKSKIFVSKKLT